jgi:hypothetical protein
MVWYSTVQYSTVQYSTVQYSTVQYSTVQYSTVQYSTVYSIVYNTKSIVGHRVDAYLARIHLARLSLVSRGKHSSLISLCTNDEESKVSNDWHLPFLR